MKNAKIVSILLAACFAYTTVLAQQGEVRMTASLAGAAPMGQFKNIVEKTSLRGVDISVLYGANDKLGIGLNVGFQDFYQKFPRGLYKLSDGSDISAVLTNSLQTIPFLATAKYNFMPGGMIQPYLSVGAGGAAVLYKQYIGEYPAETNKISFAARPSAGVYIPFKKDGETGLNVGVNYTFISYKQNDVSNLSYLGFIVGIGFPMRK